MAGPITWRTVQGASLSEASRPLEAAQRAIQGGIGGLQTLVSDQQQIAQNGIDRTNEANVQAFLDRLQGARTPEEVAALQQSGQLDSLRSALAPKDLVKVRGAEENRTASLMQQLTTKNTFDAQQKAARLAPVKDQVMGLYMTGDATKQAQARSLLEANPDLPAAEIMKAMNDFDQAKATRDFQAKLNPLKLQEAEASIENSKKTAAYQEEQRLLLAKQREAAANAAQTAADQEAMRKKGNVYADGYFNPSDTETLVKMMDDAGIEPEKRAPMIDRLRRIGTTMPLKFINANNKEDTMDTPLPLSLVKQAILGATDEFVPFGWNQGPANTMEAGLRKSMLQFYDQDMGGGRLARQNKVVADAKQFEELVEKARKNPAVSAKK